MTEIGLPWSETVPGRSEDVPCQQEESHPGSEPVPPALNALRMRFESCRSIDPVAEVFVPRPGSVLIPIGVRSTSVSFVA